MVGVRGARADAPNEVRHSLQVRELALRVEAQEPLEGLLQEEVDEGYVGPSQERFVFQLVLQLLELALEFLKEALAFLLVLLRVGQFLQVEIQLLDEEQELVAEELVLEGLAEKRCLVGLAADVFDNDVKIVDVNIV